MTLVERVIAWCEANPNTEVTACEHDHCVLATMYGAMAVTYARVLMPDEEIRETTDEERAIIGWFDGTFDKGLPTPAGKVAKRLRAANEEGLFS